jgi:HEXXH motif-containing protein
VYGGIRLVAFDHSPLAAVEAHPDKAGSHADLGGLAPTDWVEAIREPLQWVHRAHPALGAEISLALRDIVATGYHPEKHLSASYAEALGAIYLTLHPQPITMMEALIHEFQHNKLNALAQLDPLLHNAWHPLYSSPVRPDPRPLMGVLLAAHAFVAVAEVYFAIAEINAPESRRADFWSRLATIATKNRQACETLENANPTQHGAALLQALYALEESQRLRLKGA